MPAPGPTGPNKTPWTIFLSFSILLTLYSPRAAGSSRQWRAGRGGPREGTHTHTHAGAAAPADRQSEGEGGGALRPRGQAPRGKAARPRRGPSVRLQLPPEQERAEQRSSAPPSVPAAPAVSCRAISVPSSGVVAASAHHPSSAASSAATSAATSPTDLPNGINGVCVCVSNCAQLHREVRFAAPRRVSSPRDWDQPVMPLHDAVAVLGVPWRGWAWPIASPVAGTVSNGSSQSVLFEEEKTDFGGKQRCALHR